MAIAEYARSLLVIPKTLAVNAAQDATDLVAKLRAFHNSSQTKKEYANLKWYDYFVTHSTFIFSMINTPLTYFIIHRYGLDLHEGKVCDNRQAGVLEPAISKIKSLKFATEAAITILRIDDMIRLQAEAKEDRYRNYEDDY